MTTSKFALPDISEPLVDRATGYVNPNWYRALELLETQLGLFVDNIDALTTVAAALQSAKDHQTDLIKNLQAQFEDFGNIAFTGTGGVTGSGTINGAINGDPIELTLADIADKSFLANFSGGADTPVATSLASVLAHADFIEAVQDIVGALISSAGGITVTYNDGANTLTLSVP